ncbi:RNA polymerase sigma factor [Bacillaceae bacterium IKA-2]|nr:RNA polymerase sigma factor [Bacillaceae bacterium IKA-2]
MGKLLTDKELIAEIKLGSQSAMEVFVKRYYKMAYSFIYRKVTDKDIASDLTQEVLMKMLKKINSYSDKGEFKNWLLTIASNHCRDFFKSKEFRHFSNLKELNDNHSTEEDVTFIFNNNEKRRTIKTALQCLPDFQSEVIILKYYHDLKIKEIADVTKTSESTVKSRLKQGISKLKIFLRKDDFYEENRK